MQIDGQNETCEEPSTCLGQYCEYRKVVEITVTNDDNSTEIKTERQQGCFSMSSNGHLGYDAVFWLNWNKFDKLAC